MFKNIEIKKIALWLAIAAVACFAVSGLLLYQIDLKDANNSKYSYSVNEQKSFGLDEIKDIDINTFSADVTIIPAADNNVKVHVYGSGYEKNEENRVKPQISLENGRLIISEDKGNRVRFGINLNLGELIHRKEMKADIYLPAAYAEKMRIETSSGDVKAESIKVKELTVNTFSGDVEVKDVAADKVHFETSSGDTETGAIQSKDFSFNSFSGDCDFKSVNSEKATFETSSGNIELGMVKAMSTKCNTFSGNVRIDIMEIEDSIIDTSSGNIQIQKLSGGKVHGKTFSGNIRLDDANMKETVLDTSSGIIEIEGLTGSFTADSFSGNIKADYDEFTGKINVNSSSGNVEIKLPENSTFMLDADSSSGNVRCDFPVAMEEDVDRHQIKGIVGNASNTIAIETFSGEISIER